MFFLYFQKFKIEIKVRHSNNTKMMVVMMIRVTTDNVRHDDGDDCKDSDKATTAMGIEKTTQSRGSDCI